MNIITLTFMYTVYDTRTYYKQDKAYIYLTLLFIYTVYDTHTTSKPVLLYIIIMREETDALNLT